MAAKTPKPDRREYTLMLVPHQGQSVVSVRLPIKVIKMGVAAFGIMLVGLVGLFFFYHNAAHMADSEKTELERLRVANSSQSQQIQQLAQTTAGLQQDMSRLNQLDAEIRKMVNGEDNNTASRAGTVRPSLGYSGQGGPGNPVTTPSLEELSVTIKDLQASMKERELSLTELKNGLAEKNKRLAFTPSIWPASGDVTSRFGWRNGPWGGGNDWHPGIDIANNYGTAVCATADGEVIYAGWDGGYGKMVQIDHGNGIVTVYGHNQAILVHTGQHVKKGEVISEMGSTGMSTGPHVHYEVRVNGTAVDPASFL